MLFRRLYSSLPPHRAAQSAVSASTSAAATRAPTRGRARRLSFTARRDKTAVAAAPVATAARETHAVNAHEGRGRRLRRSIAPRTDLVSSEMPYDPAAFRPISLYPLEAGLHLGMTPSHMPLPLNLGTRPYATTAFSSSRVEGLFERPTANPADALPSLQAGSALGEHLRVTMAFAHPALVHHLGAEAPAASVSVLDIDTHHQHVSSALDAAAGRHAAAGDEAWEAALAALGAPSAKAEAEAVSSAEIAAAAAAEQRSLDDAVAGLDGLLARLGADESSDIVVSLDSVKRKRRKKINKHKYKKRRKATRAQRKRLGK